MSFLAYNGSSQKEVAPNVGHNYLEVRWTTVYEYWINSNLDDLYKICDKTFLIGSCMSVSLSLQHTHTHTHTHIYSWILCGVGKRKELSREREVIRKMKEILGHEKIILLDAVVQP